MIPAFDKRGSLPPGKPYRTSWEQLVKRFATNTHRQSLCQGLLAAAQNLKTAGCKTIYVDGSFVTTKAYPSDWDGCWELDGVDLYLVDPAIIDSDFFPDRVKQIYKGDLFLNAPRLPGGNFLAFFQHDRDGLKKGIISLDLATLP